MYFSKGKIPETFIINSLHKAVQTKKTAYPGAINSFLGVVRNDKNKAGKKIKYIDYKCYETMAQKKMHRIHAILLKKFNLSFLVLIHGTGKIKAGDPSLFILATSKHSKQTLQAMKDAVKLVKTTVPIWKKEVFEDGSYRWVE